MRSLAAKHTQVVKQPCSCIPRRVLTVYATPRFNLAAKGSHTGSAVPASQPHQQQQVQHRQRPVVRPVRESDKQAWLSLFKDYIEWYKASVPDEVIELTWQRMLAGGEGSHQGLVAEDGNGQVCDKGAWASQKAFCGQPL